MLELPVHRYRGRDGAELAYRVAGEGRPLLLLHGFLSTATTNWIRFGHAEALAARGHRVVMPDLRGHGDSDRSHEPASYPPDVLVDDALGLVDQLGLVDGSYDLGGYSLGARTVVRMLLEGARPGRAIVAGMGLDAITVTDRSNAGFRRVLTHLGTFDRGSPEWTVEAFLRSNHGDPEALVLALDSSVDTPVEDIALIDTSTLVLLGADDTAHASAEDLAARLPDAHFQLVPGNHMSAVTRPELALAIADFLDEPESG